MIKLSFRLSGELPLDTNLIISSLPFGEEEIQRLLSIKNNDAQRLSLSALLALSDTLSAENNCTILRTENRKPYFKDLPLSFSLSHIDHIAAAAVCDTPVGIDMEWLDDKRNVKAISSRFFSKDEQTNIANSSDPLNSFFSAWTKKEAYAKLTGKGLASIYASELPVGLFFRQYQLDLCGKKGILSICQQNNKEILILNPYDELKIIELN